MIAERVKRNKNNCEVIKRLSKGSLGPEEMDKIGASLNGGRTLEEMESGQTLANIFSEYFGGNPA